jgi:hypothetical protein
VDANGHHHTRNDDLGDIVGDSGREAPVVHKEAVRFPTAG